MQALCARGGGLLVAMMLWSGLVHATPQVAVSIAPVHGWVSQVSGDLWEPELLLPAENDPHNALLRPSQRQVITDADWVIWVGPQLETGLTALMGRVDSERLWTLTDNSPELVLHDFRQSGTVFSTPDDGHDNGHPMPDIDFPGSDENGEDSRPGHSGIDPHVWLDPENARRALNHIAERLSELDPDNAETYRRNADAGIERLHDQESIWAERLADADPRPYLVFHDGYQYFDRAFDLTFAGAVTLNPEQLPGLRTINRMRDGIADGELGCLFAEVQYSDRLVQTIGTGFNLDIQRIDALGAGIPLGEAHYGELMDQLTTAFVDCR